MRQATPKPPGALRSLATAAANVLLYSEAARAAARYLYNRTGAGEADAIGYAFHQVLQMNPGVEGVVVVKFREEHPTGEILGMVGVVQPRRPWTVVAPQHPQPDPTAGFPTAPPGGSYGQG